MRGMVVSVEYGDLLAVTLPENAKHFSEVLVITTEADQETISVANRVQNALVQTTDLFYRGGAVFNKGLAIEEGFDAVGRDGWTCVFDADILMPPNLRALVAHVQSGYLYSPHRRICRNLAEWHGERDWSKWPRVPDYEFAGYFQLFHGCDPVLQTRPWYGVNWRHAAGCDSDFQHRWPADRKIRLPFDVLHLGEDGQNWHGRATVRLDGAMPEKAAERQAMQARMRELRAEHGCRLERL